MDIRKPIGCGYNYLHHSPHFKDSKRYRYKIKFCDKATIKITDFRPAEQYGFAGFFVSTFCYEDEAAHIIRILYGRRDYMKILFGEASEDDNE
jgi:hypothetical protein